MKTVRQLADELGVTKQAVRKQVDKLPPNLISTGNNRTILINNEGIEIIRDKVLSKRPTVDTNEIPKKEMVDTLVGMLQTELKSKNALIESQSRQLEEQTATIREQGQSIQDLTAALSRQQALHAGTIQHQLTEGGGAELTDNEQEIRLESKLGFVARLKYVFTGKY